MRIHFYIFGEIHLTLDIAAVFRLVKKEKKSCNRSEMNKKNNGQNANEQNMEKAKVNLKFEIFFFVFSLEPSDNHKN